MVVSFARLWPWRGKWLLQFQLKEGSWNFVSALLTTFRAPSRSDMDQVSPCSDIVLG